MASSAQPYDPKTGQQLVTKVDPAATPAPIFSSSGKQQPGKDSSGNAYSPTNVPPGSIYGQDGSITTPDGTVIQGPSQSGNTTYPRVTPSGTPSNPAPVNNEPTPESDGGTNNNPVPLPNVPSEDQAYAGLLNQSHDLIQGTTDKYNEELNAASSNANAVAAAEGLGGSTVAGGMTEAAQAPILAQRSIDLGNIYSQIQQNAQSLQQQEFTQEETSYQDKLAAAATAKQNASDSIKAMAAAHLDWNNYKKTNPDNYNALVQALGGDPNVADAMFASSMPAQNILSTTFNGSNALVVTQDPVTGKTQALTYNLGVTIPQNWTQDKISNNTVIYHGPVWDPQDPSTYQMFSIDPLTGIPTAQVGGNTNSTMGDATVASVNDLVTQQGVKQDAAAPIDPANVTAISSALIQHENSQLPSDFNNPGDIKYYDGLPNATDSGVKASDGGTWAKFDTNADGETAVQNIVSTAAQKGMSFSDFVKSYTGTGTPTTTGSAAGDAHQQAVDGWVKNIINGTATLTNVPAAARTAVSDALANQDSSTLPPLALSRLTTVANKIVSNYINMPAYQLTAGGQLYLGRIAAAEKTPGSVSDQDLLDSLTKLNTGGNAISDAQVKLITDGQSFSDWASVLQNKTANGGVLSDAQRQQVQKLAQNIFKSYQEAYQPIYDQATKQLQDAGIPKDLWTIPDLNNLTSGDASANTSSQNAALPDGVTSGSTINYNGQQYTVDDQGNLTPIQ